MDPLPDPLETILQERFGFGAFRPHQRAACEAAAAGEDVLLVMPTGAGKSLCYQLPGIARGGSTLVVSPLIALMEDQAAKLKALGLAADRIHSGRPRADARRSLEDWTAGRLSFLFVAPERLAVPGFPEALARRRPALVAVDEAHCISEWGHDFRPEYRMLGRRLPSLRPAPVMALTATATPRVQEDIVAQLALSGPPRIFIRGFRRANLAIEMVPLNPGARTEAARRVLGAAGRLPAILYAPTRKSAEALARALAPRFRTAAYHAGLPPPVRDAVQRDFGAGELDAVVATIAFGMGVDKADVRTVVHMALPGSVEAYYQEIGRAGRDGEEARAILFHGYVDRRTHEYFLERDYADPALLARVHGALDGRTVSFPALAAELDLDESSLDRALEKLSTHGGIEISADGLLRGLAGDWRSSYRARRERRAAQLDEIARLAEGFGCRMAAVVVHFGDREDSGAPCGTCDFCAPAGSVAARFRPLRPDEAAVAASALRALAREDGRSTGALLRELAAETPADRATFDRVLAALARARFVRVAEESFEKEGRTIRYRRVALTAAGRDAPPAASGELQVESTAEGQAPRPRGRRARAASAAPGAAGARTDADAASPAPSVALVRRLRAWRLAEARARAVPAFVIFADRTLEALAVSRPLDRAGLLAVRGIGRVLADRYGETLLALLKE